MGGKGFKEKTEGFNWILGRVREETGKGNHRRIAWRIEDGVAGDHGLRSTVNPIGSTVNPIGLFSVVSSCQGVGVGKAGQLDPIFRIFKV